ncbi:TSUP family transporter, partial [candidate division KSB1 bacterium]
TLIGMIISSVAGAVLGAGIVAKLPERKIQLGMGIALLIVAFVMFAGLMDWFPIGGEAIGLKGGKLIFAIAANFVIGALMTIGVGSYAPCMALVYSLGMSPRAAFPIMMGSCAFLMPAASIKFVKKNSQDRKASLAITIGGIAGVPLAAYLVKSLPLTILKWVIIGVVLYTSAMMFKSVAEKVDKQENI